MQLSLRWAERSQARLRRNLASGLAKPGQALFGIVQGGIETALRRRSADALVAMDCPATPSAGWRSAKATTSMLDALEATLPFLPADKPRYLMGVGTPLDLIESVARGIDMFDCVLPTRTAGTASPSPGAARSTCSNARHADDPRPLDPESPCPAARDYSRAYLHHLVKSGEMLGAMLLSWANIAFYQELMAAMRAAIAEGRFAAWAEAHKDRMSSRNG